MKKKYETPEVLIIELVLEDVITNSGDTIQNGGTGDGDELDWDGFF